MIVSNFVNTSAEGDAVALSQKRSQHFKLDFCCQGTCVLRMDVRNFVDPVLKGVLEPYLKSDHNILSLIFVVKVRVS